ncbi:unnamed protein product [Heterotrigona itama]|uniref:Dynein regulatory complex protein 1/2 N-terminal domain-containing protein n=1 Tax=Heterotrigona itama TaxID=395501 RepID=A0A6V7H8F3_9HYME|nr:unnamed protein product [Heterotrigona itama]
MAPKLRGKARNESIRNAPRVKREKFLRELDLAALNAERNRRFWRETLTRVKMPDVWRKIDVTWQTLERAIDFKGYSISLLLDSLREAENQRRTTNGALVGLIDKSLAAHETRLADAATLFRANVETALADKISQFENINNHRNEREIALRKIRLLVSHRGENASNIATSTAISKIDAFVEDGENEKRIIITQLRTKLENSWAGLRNVFSDYRKSTYACAPDTEDRRKDYEIVERKDRIDRQTITRQYTRVAILFDSIVKFRGKIDSYKKESTVELRDVTRESNFFHDVYRETNERFVLGCKKDKHKTTTMSEEYNRSVKHARRLLIKAERILGYVQICRKYETQDEKIQLPTIDDRPTRSSITDDDDDILPLRTVRYTRYARCYYFSCKTTTRSRAATDFRRTVNFWRRLGLARIITAELRNERNRLTVRANNLRRLMRRCLVDDETVDEPTDVIYLLPSPRWNVTALMENGKFDIFTPSLAHKANNKRIGAKHRPVNKFETKAGGLFSGWRNMCCKHVANTFVNERDDIVDQRECFAPTYNRLEKDNSSRQSIGERAIGQGFGDAYLSVGEGCKLCLLNMTTSSPTLVAEFAVTLIELLALIGLPSTSQTLIVTKGCRVEILISSLANVTQVGLSKSLFAKVVKAESKLETPLGVCTERRDRR